MLVSLFEHHDLTELHCSFGRLRQRQFTDRLHQGAFKYALFRNAKKQRTDENVASLI